MTDTTEGLQPLMADLQAQVAGLREAGQSVWGLVNRLKDERSGPYAINNCIACSPEFDALTKALAQVTGKDQANGSP